MAAEQCVSQVRQRCLLFASDEISKTLSGY